MAELSPTDSPDSFLFLKFLFLGRLHSYRGSHNTTERKLFHVKTAYEGN